MLSKTREPRMAALRNEERERGSLDYDECTSPFVLGRKLEQGLNPGILIRASRALGEFEVTESLGNNGF